VPVDETEQVELKETDVGLMTNKWSLTKLGEIASFRNGINFKSEQKGDTGILAIDVLNMYTDSIYPSTKELYRVDKKVKDDYLLKEGDLLFVRSSLKQEGVGWTTVFEENLSDEPLTYVGFIIRARLKDYEINPKFLAYYFRSDIGRENLIKSSGKVAITNINQGMLGSNIIPKPNIKIQNQIVESLDTLNAKIQQEIDKKKSLEALFNSLLENLMTAKIRVN
jgi:type I restriction enzyme S subunit